jgi:hypothetical protein
VGVEREVGSVADGVDGHDRQPPSADHRCVVTGTAQQALAAGLEQLLERRDQVQFTHGYSLNGSPPP